MRLVSRQTVRDIAAVSKASRARIGYADIVLQFAPDLADEVMSGATPLDTVRGVRLMNCPSSS
jgi:hypothetical protein